MTVCHLILGQFPIHHEMLEVTGYTVALKIAWTDGNAVSVTALPWRYCQSDIVLLATLLWLYTR